MEINYRSLGEITESDIRELADVLFSEESVISDLKISEDIIEFDISCKSKDDNGEPITMTDSIHMDWTEIDSPSLYMTDKDESIYRKWLLAKGVDSRLKNNPFIKE